MSKILDATCSAVGVVTSGGVPVLAAEVLSEGKQSSEGLLFLDGDKARYLPSSATDIKTSLEKISSALGTIASALTAIGAGMAGSATAPPGSLGASVSQINQVAAELAALKEALK